jgi:hypothetical protein
MGIDAPDVLRSADCGDGNSGRHVNRFFTGKIDAKQAELLWTVAQIAAIWIVSDMGYTICCPA